MNERVRRDLSVHAWSVAAGARARGDEDTAQRWETLARLWDTDPAAALAHLFRTDWARQRERLWDVDPDTADAFARLDEGGDDAA